MPTPDAFPEIVDHLRRLEVQESRNGDTHEDWMVAVKSDDPRKRWLDRPKANWAFGLQECFAYWMGENPGHVHRYNSNMENYMRDGKLEGSAYGRYLRRFPHDQIDRVLKQLTENPETRRAVINIHNAMIEDYDGPDVACTIYLQFLVRDGELHCTANLRSQDMLWGYPYDAHAFQWIQEAMAGILQLDLGTYTHVMNSCHYYKDFEDHVLDSADECTSYSLPDCRLPAYEVTEVMEYLEAGLSEARSGSIPSSKIDNIQTYSNFYADWLRLMTAYELRRFHDSFLWETLVENIEVEAFWDFMQPNDEP